MLFLPHTFCKRFFYRKSLWESEKIRINVLNPGVTDTNMANVVANAFRKAGLQDAVNMPEDLAVTILGFLTETDMWGKSVYVEGGKGWEWEQEILEQNMSSVEPYHGLRYESEADCLR